MLIRGEIRHVNYCLGGENARKFSFKAIGDPIDPLGHRDQSLYLAVIED